MAYFDVLGYTYDGAVYCTKCWKGVPEGKAEEEAAPVFEGEAPDPAGVYCDNCAQELVEPAAWYTQYHKDAGTVDRVCWGRTSAWLTADEAGTECDKATVRMILTQDREGDEAKAIAVTSTVSSYLECARAAWDKELKAGTEGYWCGTHRAVIDDE